MTSTTATPFVWTATDGTEIALNTTDLHAGIFRRIRKLDDMDAMFTLLESVADDDALKSIDALPLSDLPALFKAWLEAAQGGASLPQS